MPPLPCARSRSFAKKSGVSGGNGSRPARSATRSDALRYLCVEFHEITR
jgi:hypothetical protein